ncbi:MAG: class B sortase [Clostridia bacterium]|nr:class B sortase [Clostridia bacterium]
MAENTNERKKSKKGIRLVTLVFILGFCVTAYVWLILNLSKQHYNYDYAKIISEIKIDESQITEEISERVLKVRVLKETVNEEIVGWLEIENTNITFPVVQGSDNDYYLKHTYIKEESSDGSIFLDKDYDWSLPSSNLLIYGHNNLNGNMFQELLRYEEKNYYQEHPQIRFTTAWEDCYYDIIAVFRSRVYYQDEEDVFRYYYFIDGEIEEEYRDFVDNCKADSLYEIEETAEFGEQLLTLSTCEYSQEDGRFVIVARKQRK